MEKKLTSTEVVRGFGDILAEVKHGGLTILVTKNGETVAELRPVEPPRKMTLKGFAAAWEDSTDDSFATDLERINRSDLSPKNPWE